MSPTELASLKRLADADWRYVVDLPRYMGPKRARRMARLGWVEFGVPSARGGIVWGKSWPLLHVDQITPIRITHGGRIALRLAEAS